MNHPFCKFALVLWALALSAPAGAAGDHPHGHDDQQAAPGVATADPARGRDEGLRLDAAARRAAGIEVATVGRRTLAATVNAPGEVQLNGYRAHKLAPRIGAQIERRHVRLGETVAVGQPLVTLSSVALAEAQAAFVVAAREWQRVQALGERLVSARRHGEARAGHELARAKLLAYGMDEAALAALLDARAPQPADGRYTLRAPIAGTVIADAFTTGEFVEPGRVLFELADAARPWVEARLPPAQAAAITVGAQARVRTGTVALAGRVVAVLPRVDEATRTQGVRVEIDDARGRLRPGQLVEVALEIADTGAAVLAIPHAAIVLLAGEPSVFRLAGDAFQPQVVTVGATQGGWTEIRAGLAPGDEIAVKGGYALKSRLLKSQLGHGHAH